MGKTEPVSNPSANLFVIIFPLILQEFAESQRIVQSWEQELPEDFIFTVWLDRCQIDTFKPSAGVKRALRDSPVVEIHSQVLKLHLHTNNRNRGTVNSADGISSDGGIFALLVATEME